MTLYSTYCALSETFPVTIKKHLLRVIVIASCLLGKARISSLPTTVPLLCNVTDIRLHIQPPQIRDCLPPHRLHISLRDVFIQYQDSPSFFCTGLDWNPAALLSFPFFCFQFISILVSINWIIRCIFDKVRAYIRNFKENYCTFMLKSKKTSEILCYVGYFYVDV